MTQPRHERLSAALCEAVEFGTPTLIRMGHEDFLDLLASVDRDSMHKIDRMAETFEGVRIEREGGRCGCIVEHDNRYGGRHAYWGKVALATDLVMQPISVTKPPITAW